MTHRLKTAAAVAAMTAAVLSVPAAASADPAKPADGTLFSVRTGKIDTSRMRTAAPAQTQALVSQYNCTTGYYPPGYSIDFHCTVTSGAIQIYLECTDPRIAGYSPVLRAPGTYDLRAVCGPPAVWRYFNFVDAV
jgi:hypothetical protein